MILPTARMVRGAQANERLRLAVVGMAGYGAWHGFAEAIHTYRNVGYAVSCDVDLRKVQKVYELWDKRSAEWAKSDQQEQRKAAGEFFGALAAKKPPHHGYPPDYAPGSRIMLEGILRDHGAAAGRDPFLLLARSTGKGEEAAQLDVLELTLRQQRDGRVVTGCGQQALAAQDQAPGGRQKVRRFRGGPMPLANFDCAAPFAEFLCVGSLATRFPGDIIEFDPASGQITNHSRAAEFLRYEYRKGWTI